MTDFTDAMWDAFDQFAMEAGYSSPSDGYRDAQQVWEEAWFTCRDYLESGE